MLKQKTPSIILWVTIIWFLFIPLFWQFDLSKSTSFFYDAFEMAPLGLPHILFFYSLVFLCLYKRGFSFSILLLINLYFPFIQLINYPFLTYRDVYVHAAPVQTILADGHLNFTRDSNPGSWPGSFNLHSITSIVTGTDLIISNYLLYFTLIIILTLVLYCFVKKLEKKGLNFAGYGAVLFLCLFSNYLFDFNHYSRATLEFILLFLFFYSFFFINGRRGYIIQIITTLVLIISHPFASFALISFTVFNYLLTPPKKRFQKINFVFFSIGSFVGWFFFAAFERFIEAGYKLQTFFLPQYLSPVSQTFTVKETLPLWGTFLRELFRYSQIAFLGIGCIFLLYVTYQSLRYKEIDDLKIALVSLVPMALMILFALLLLPDWQISRFSAFAAFPAAFSFLIIPNLIRTDKKLTNIFQMKLINKRIKYIKRVFPTFLLCFIIILSTGVMIVRFEKNYYNGEMSRPSELASLSFLFSHDTNSSYAAISWRTAVTASYFNWRGTHESNVVWYIDLNHMKGNSTQLLASESALINQSQIVIRGTRDKLDLSHFNNTELILNTIDNEMIYPEFSNTYSNGYYSIYTRESTLP